MTMAVDDVYEVVWQQLCRANSAVNVRHYRETEACANPLDSAGNLATGFLDTVADVVKDQLAAEWRTTGAFVRRIIPGPGIPASIVLGGAEVIVGQIEDDSIPTSAAAVVTLRSDNGTRQGRGRLYLYGLPESAQRAGQIEAAVFTDIETVVQSLKSSVPGPGGD